jgi:hypothetical protein
MSTKLNQFGLTLNLLNNSKSVENQSKMQLQNLFKITPSSCTNFTEIFLNFELFLLSNFCFGSVFNPEIFCRWVPPVGLLYPASGPACQGFDSTWHHVPRHSLRGHHTPMRARR